jgi:hypothetical protein
MRNGSVQAFIPRIVLAIRGMFIFPCNSGGIFLMFCFFRS